MFCKKCGYVLSETDEFCPVCGTKIDSEKPLNAPVLHPWQCVSCGSNDIRELKAGVFQCAHCNTMFSMEERAEQNDETSEETEVALLLAEAERYAGKTDIRKEIQTLLKALAIDPENNDVLLRLGRAYWKVDLTEKALEYYRKAEALYPEDPIVYSNIAAAYLKQRKNSEAKEQYEKSIAMIEADPFSAVPSDIAVVYGNYALCLGRLGDRKNARKYLSIAKAKGYSPESIRTICQELNLNRFLL